MTPRTSAALIETYLDRLRLELNSVGAAEVDDLVAEVRSLLIDAAGDDPERAVVEIAKFGEPAELAAGILAERGLSAEGGMSTAEWWRMGIAVPIDIAIGISVPAAVFFPLYLVLSGDPRSAPLVALAIVALFAGALAWPWYVWRPWRAGGSRSTAGMALTGIAVVRAPGFWRVVRSEDLARMGLVRPRRSRLSAVAPAVLALLLVAWSVQASSQWVFRSTVPSWASTLGGSETEQRGAVLGAIDQLYGAVGQGDFGQARTLVSDNASEPQGGLALMEKRTAKDEPRSYRIADERLVTSGVWSARVTTTGASGTTYADTVTVGFNLLMLERGYVGQWLITDIEGPGLAPSQ